MRLSFVYLFLNLKHYIIDLVISNDNYEIKAYFLFNAFNFSLIKNEFILFCDCALKSSAALYSFKVLTRWYFWIFFWSYSLWNWLISNNSAGLNSFRFETVCPFWIWVNDLFVVVILSLINICYNSCNLFLSDTFHLATSH